MIYNLEDLEVYQRAEKLADMIWLEIAAWNDHFVKDTIGKQLVRAFDSICANIAEGFGRYHYNKNFCYYSRDSTRTTGKRLKKRNLIPEQTVNELLKESEQIHKMLNSYIKSIAND